jgi:hypothetical protein
MERTPIQSSSISAVRYDAKHSELEISFRSGRTYRYFDVPQSVYAWLLRVPSVGTYVNRHIRDRYRFEEVTTSTTHEPELSEALRRSLKRPRHGDES